MWTVPKVLDQIVRAMDKASAPQSKFHDSEFAAHTHHFLPKLKKKQCSQIVPRVSADPVDVKNDSQQDSRPKIGCSSNFLRERESDFDPF